MLKTCLTRRIIFSCCSQIKRILNWLTDQKQRSPRDEKRMKFISTVLLHYWKFFQKYVGAVQSRSRFHIETNKPNGDATTAQARGLGLLKFRYREQLDNFYCTQELFSACKRCRKSYHYIITNYTCASDAGFNLHDLTDNLLLRGRYFVKFVTNNKEPLMTVWLIITYIFPIPRNDYTSSIICSAKFEATFLLLCTLGVYVILRITSSESESLYILCSF